VDIVVNEAETMVMDATGGAEGQTMGHGGRGRPLPTMAGGGPGMGVILGLGLMATLLVGACASAQESSQQAARGREVFREQGCYGCHTIGKIGTPIASDLSRIGARHDEASLAAWLRNPALQRPTAHMPKLQLSETEVRALAAYLASQR